MPLLNSKEISSRANEARIHSRNILKKLMKTKLGQKEKILFENFKTSYTNNFYKVSVNPKKELDIKSGLTYDVKLKTISNGKFLAEF